MGKRAIVDGFGHALDGVLFAVRRSEVDSTIDSSRSATGQEINEEDGVVGDGRAGKIAAVGGRERHGKMRCWVSEF